MNDKEIRSILIAYLNIQDKPLRVYQEKNIGAAVCDVMEVSDKLVGYEIKSDQDNYSRLERQIKFYNQFFDENYLVVGASHANSAEEKIPSFWGIIRVGEDGLTILRRAGKNKQVSRRSQLSLLWKIELKNLLIKNRMPLYAQQNKDYIVDRIVKAVAPEVLIKQITEELLNRDYDLLSLGEECEDFETLPAAEIVDTLSEENLTEISLDKWIDLYRMAKQVQQKKEAYIVKNRPQRAPHAITYKDIEPTLGAPWISCAIVNDFVNEVLRGVKEGRSLVKYEPVTGGWYVNGKRWERSTRLDVQYGTERYNALEILEAMLNLREIKVYSSQAQLDEAETIAVMEKQNLIAETFATWLWQDEDRIWEVEEAYNNLFSQYGNKHYDGQNLSFPHMNEQYDLYDYQKDAVERIIQTPNTLLAFDVGAGKTYIMIAAAMKMRQMGLSQKNMFVVPNNIVGQWEKIFTTLYPEAKVLTVEPKSFKRPMRQKVLTQIKNGDYDGIIIAYSCFEQIPLSVGYITDMMQQKTTELEETIKGMRDNMGMSVWNSRFKREIAAVEKIAKELMKSAHLRCGGITFETLEINTLFVDEAHNFKNIPIQTNLKNLRGINVTGSRKCLEMLHKVRCVQAHNNGRGAVFATGTPLCNSISDAYTMQMYLQYDDLRVRHFDRFDNWVKTFAVAEQCCEVDVTGADYRFVRRFARFHNLPELSKMFSAVACFYSVQAQDAIPEQVAYENTVTRPSENLKAYMEHICDRAERIRSKRISPRVDNMLKISTDGRKASLDLNLVGRPQSYDSRSKLVLCADKVMEIFKKNPDCSQLVFCDYSTPRTEGFTVYDKLKDLLVERGMAAKEIAFVHSYQSESRKIELYEQVNDARIKVLIGSTFKLGIGANVQRRLKAIHHLDVPWRPADMIQREGRIVRRGNENREVTIRRYITEGSFDSYCWQILENKQRFISQFLSGHATQRSIEDLEENVLSYAEVKAIALGEPILKQIAETQNQVKTLEIMCNKHAENIRKAQVHKKKIATQLLPAAREYFAETDANGRYVKTISNEQYIEAMRAAEGVFAAENLRCFAKDETVTEFLQFAVKKGEGDTVILVRRNTSYPVEMGESTAGNLRRVVNFFKGFGKRVQEAKAQCNQLEDELREIEAALALPNEPYNKLCECEKELCKLIQLAEKSKMLRDSA